MDNCRESQIDFSRYKVLKDGNIISLFKNSAMTTRNKCGKEVQYIINTFRRLDGKQETFARHRVIWYYFNGDIPNGIQVCHKDTNTENNCLDNLYLGTPQDNMNNPLTRAKLEESYKNEDRNKKISLGNIGKVVSQEQKDKQSKSMSGEKHPFWGKKRPRQSQIMKEKKRDKQGRWY